MSLAVDVPFYQDQIEGFGDHAVGLGDLAASLKIMHPGMKSDGAFTSQGYSLNPMLAWTFGMTRIVNITSWPFLEVFPKDQVHLALGTRNTFASGWSASFVVEGGLSIQENFTQWAVNHEGDGTIRSRSYATTPCGRPSPIPCNTKPSRIPIAS